MDDGKSGLISTPSEDAVYSTETCDGLVEKTPCASRLLILIGIGAILWPRTVIGIARTLTTSRGRASQPEEQAQGQHARKNKSKNAADDRCIGYGDEQGDVHPGDGDYVHGVGVIYRANRSTRFARN